MYIQLGQFRTTLRPWPSAIVTLGLAILLGLGTWQMQRAAEKQRVLAEHDSKMHSEPIALPGAGAVPAELLHLHPVTARGTLDGARTMLLDNRIRNRTVGYDVLVPLRLAGGDAAVLVNRGWVPRGAQRDVKPRVEHPTGDVQVRGLAVLPTRGYRLGGMLEPESAWPHVVQFVALEEMRTLTGYELLPVVLRLASEDPLALDTGWPVITMGPQRHYGYAVQWYGLALALLAVYLVASTRRRI